MSSMGVTLLVPSSELPPHPDAAITIAVNVLDKIQWRARMGSVYHASSTPSRLRPSLSDR